MNKQKANRNQAAAGAEKKDVYQVITARIIEQLQKGVVPWQKSWNTIQPQNLVSKRPYRGFNRLLLSCLGFESSYFLTIQQVNQLGGRVRKGEKGIPVVYYKSSYKLADGSFSDGSGLTAEQKQGLEKSSLLKYYFVFNVSQCEGIDGHVPSPSSPEMTESVDGFHICDMILDSYPNGPIVQQADSMEPCYFPQMDVVQMPNPTLFSSPHHYYMTLFHELVHSTGHSSRLARPEVTSRSVRFGDPEYSREELVAEIGACFLSNHAGILNEEVFQSNASYLKSWISKLQEDPKLIVFAASAAQKATEYILNTQQDALAA